MHVGIHQDSVRSSSCQSVASDYVDIVFPIEEGEALHCVHENCLSIFSSCIIKDDWLLSVRKSYLNSGSYL